MTSTSAFTSTRADAAAPSKGARIAGLIVSGLVVLFLLFDSVIHLLNTSQVQEAMTDLGFDPSLNRVFGIVLLVCLIAYVIPRVVDPRRGTAHRLPRWRGRDEPAHRTADREHDPLPDLHRHLRVGGRPVAARPRGPADHADPARVTTTNGPTSVTVKRGSSNSDFGYVTV